MIKQVALFFAYLIWVFSSRARYASRHSVKSRPVSVKNFRHFLKDLTHTLVALVVLVLAVEGLIQSTVEIASGLGVPFYIIGILIIALGNALPEIYFSFHAARQGRSGLVLGDLMGAIIVPATLVIGVTALIRPIEIIDPAPFTIARIFLILAALFFFFFVRSNSKVSRREGLLLLVMYLLFVFLEIAHQNGIF